jgi:ketopantoate reductase
VSCSTTTAAGGNLQAARCLILGAGALGVAYGKSLRNARTEERWFYVERQDDYENKSGFATGCIFGMQKLQFNNQDHGVFTIDTYYNSVA